MVSQLLGRGWGPGGFGRPGDRMRPRMWRRGYGRRPYGPLWRRRFGCPCGCVTLTLAGVVGASISSVLLGFMWSVIR